MILEQVIENKNFVGVPLHPQRWFLNRLIKNDFFPQRKAYFHDDMIGGHVCSREISHESLLDMDEWFEASLVINLVHNQGWPGLLQAWLALTCVNFQDNLYRF